VARSTCPATITVKELAELLTVNPADVIRELIKSGIFATINQLIDRDTASLGRERAGLRGLGGGRADERDRARGRGRGNSRGRHRRKCCSRTTTRRSSSRARPS
jgi:hypothetical protein